jgi:hypothetical protein
MADTSAPTTADDTRPGLRLVDPRRDAERCAETPAPSRVRRVLRLAARSDDLDGQRRMVLVEG